MGNTVFKVTLLILYPFQRSCRGLKTRVSIAKHYLNSFFSFLICLQSLVMSLLRKPVALVLWSHLIFMKNSITQHDYLPYLASMALNVC